MFLNKDLQFILDSLAQHGFQAYLVGGSVRDTLLGLKPHDFDIATDATPIEMKKVFPKHLIATGEDYGTMTYVVGKQHYEITTFRADGEYLDGRRPKSVAYSKDLIEDLKRRDFTINAIAYHPKMGIIDPFMGRKDLKQGLIRTVGEARKRFLEDALRILRAVRFATRFNFQIENETLYAMKISLEMLDYVSKERINTEISEIILNLQPQNKEFFKLIDGAIFPFLAEMDHDVHDVLLDRLAISCKSLTNRLAILLSPLTSEDAVTSLLALKYSKVIVKTVVVLLQYRLETIKADSVWLKYLLRDVGEKNAFEILIFKAAFALTSTEQEIIKEADLLLNQIIDRKECYKLSMLAINGNDVLSYSKFKPLDVGLILNQCLDYAIKNPSKNNRKDLFEYLILL